MGKACANQHFVPAGTLSSGVPTTICEVFGPEGEVWRFTCDSIGQQCASHVTRSPSKHVTHSAGKRVTRDSINLQRKSHVTRSAGKRVTRDSISQQVESHVSRSADERVAH